MVGEFKVLQSNFGAENAKGPTTINVVTKAGGRDFSGTGYLYLRDYHWNSNEWFLNKVGTGERRPEQAEEQVRLPGLQHRRSAAHPGHELQQEPRQAVLLLRLRVLQADLDTGTLQSWVPTAGDAERRLQRQAATCNSSVAAA